MDYIYIRLIIKNLDKIINFIFIFKKYRYNKFRYLNPY